MPRLFLSIAFCVPAFFCTVSLADKPAETAALWPEFSGEFQHGAEYVCNQPERAAKRYADVLQANCVAVDLRKGMPWDEIAGHCLGTLNRSSFEAYSSLRCGNLGI